jgi:hypothetical protein
MRKQNPNENTARTPEPACCERTTLETCCATEAKPDCCGVETAPKVCGCSSRSSKGPVIGG